MIITSNVISSFASLIFLFHFPFFACSSLCVVLRSFHSNLTLFTNPIYFLTVRQKIQYSIALYPVRCVVCTHIPVVLGLQTYFRLEFFFFHFICFLRTSTLLFSIFSLRTVYFCCSFRFSWSLRYHLQYSLFFVILFCFVFFCLSLLVVCLVHIPASMESSFLHVPLYILCVCIIIVECNMRWCRMTNIFFFSSSFCPPIQCIAFFSFLFIVLPKYVWNILKYKRWKCDKRPKTPFLWTILKTEKGKKN